MNRLRFEERKIVALLYRSPYYISFLPMADGITARLQSKSIIQLTANNSPVRGGNFRIPYTITPIAQKYIDEHPDFVKDFSREVCRFKLI